MKKVLNYIFTPILLVWVVIFLTNQFIQSALLNRIEIILLIILFPYVVYQLITLAREAYARKMK